jgi:hypothetical protein
VPVVIIHGAQTHEEELEPGAEEEAAGGAEPSEPES